MAEIFVTWNDSHLLMGNVAEAISSDTLRIWQLPVVIDTGKRLFAKGTVPRAFRLADTQQTATGAVPYVYERAGGLEYGEVEVGQGP